MITTHQYLDKYPISKESEILIVETIHPHEIEKFQLPFFYGNVNSIWNILSDAFPDDLPKPLTLENILKFLHNRKISLSDTIKKCERKKLSTLDNDLIPLELNLQMIEDIRNSNITEIFFTSSFGKTNAFKLFYEDLLGLKITPEIREKREIILNASVFGRKVKLMVLLSPSGASNIGLSKSKKYLEQKHLYQNSSRPVYDFKVDYYREIFRKS